MASLTRLTRILVVLVLLYLMFPQPAYAYLDPGTGSLIIQVVVAALLGAAFTAKIYWKNIKTFFVNRFSKKTQIEETHDDRDED